MPPLGNQRERIARLEQRILEVESRVRNIPDRVGQRLASRQVRLAKTAEFDASYPSQPANKYGIIFLDGSYDETAAGDESATFQDRSGAAPTVAYNLNPVAGYLPEDTPLAVFAHNGRWWFDSPQALVPFELTADLTAGGSADAKRLVWDAGANSYSTTGDAFTVNDTLNAATLGGKTGDQGLFYYAERDFPIIATLSTIARWLEFTLHATGGDMTDGTTTTHLVTVTEFHDGSDPGTTVTVHFEELWEANVGNVGKAILGSDGNYHNLVVDCLT